MISAISGYNPYSAYSVYGAAYANRAAQTQAAEKAQSVQRPDLVLTARKAAQPDTPVQPVTPVRPVVAAQEDPARAGLLRFGSDPAEMAVRMRIQYPGDGTQAQNADKAVLPGAQQDNAAQAANGDKARMPNLPGTKDDARQFENPVTGESKSAQEVMEEGECQTCKERKYQDGSDDPGVSFKTPTNIAPEQAASAVRGHENEHVGREQAKARQEDRKVVSQSVTYHTDICPECGKVYVSGGTTRTVTKADNSQQTDPQDQNQRQTQDPSRPVAAIS